MVEAITRSLDSVVAPRELPEGYFVPELDEEAEKVAESPIIVEGFRKQRKVLAMANREICQYWATNMVDTQEHPCYRHT